MLIVHHLQCGQSERIVWLCEELGLDYELKTYQRDAKTMMSPPELQALHPTQAAPVIQDTDANGKTITLGESGAIVEYILTKYGGGRLAISMGAENYPEYLYFLHFANGYFQPALVRYGLLQRQQKQASNSASAPGKEDPSAKFAKRNFEQALQILEARLKRTGAWLAGQEFTAADIMNVTTLTTMRMFAPYSLESFPATLEFLGRVKGREAYRRALGKSDPGLEPVMGAEAPARGKL